MDAGPREPVAKAPVFVDVSGRRRRGVSVLGYLGASACTAYLAAFGITLSTTAGTIPAAGVALDPGPAADEGAEDPETVVAVPAAGSRTEPDRTDADRTDADRTEADVATARPVTLTAHRHAARGRHAAPDRVATPARRGGARVVPLAATTPRPAVPAAGTGTPRPTPDTTPVTGGRGGSSSGGAGPTTGTGSGGSTGGDTDTDSRDGDRPGTDGTGTSVSDPATSDVLAIGPVAIGIGV